MKNPFFFRVKTISTSKKAGHKPSTLKIAAEHNLREGHKYQSNYLEINCSKSKFNEILYGPATAEEIVKASLSNFKSARRTIRNDFVQAGEIVFSPNRLIEHQKRQFFIACLDWSIRWFGEEGILSAIVHNDQPNPHMHVLLSPVINGRLCGSMLFKKGRLKSMQKDFESKVLNLFGLNFYTRTLTKSQKKELTLSVISALYTDKKPALDGIAAEAIRQSIERDPQTFAAIMGVQMVASPSNADQTEQTHLV